MPSTQAITEEEKERQAVLKDVQAILKRYGGRYRIRAVGNNVTVEHDRKCRYISEGGKRVFIPQCMGGAIYGKDGCTCGGRSRMGQFS